MDKDNVTYNVSFAFRRGTYEDLMKLNEIPKQGEPIFELDTFKFKVGDGVKTYDKLPYINMDKIDAFLADADLSAAAVDTLREIQEMLQNSEFDIAELVKKISEFETLHSELNVAIEEANKVIIEHNQTSEQIHNLLEENIAKVEKDFAAADQKIVEDASTKFDALDMDILVAKAEAVSEAKAYIDTTETKINEAIENLDNALDARLLKLEEIDHSAYINADQEVLEIVNQGDEKLSADIATAIQEFKNADSVLETKIAAAESVAATALANEIARVETAYAAADTELSNNLDKEIARATIAEAQTLTDAKLYTDKVKNDLLGEGISETFDTLVEIQDWINGDGVNATELASAIANEATNRQTQDTILSDRIDALIAQHRTDIDTINSEFEKAYDQQTEAFNNYVSEVKAELEEDDGNNLAEAKSYTDSAKSALFGEGSANFDTIVKLSAKVQELINTFPPYVAEQIGISESNMKTYIDQKIGEIENGAY